MSISAESIQCSKKIIFVNIYDLPLNRYDQLKIKIEDFKSDPDCLKIFYGKNRQQIFDNIIASFELLKRKDFIYIEILNKEKVREAFLNYSFQPFPPTISRREGSLGEKI